MKNLKINFKNMIGLKVVAGVVALSTMVGTLSGCSKKVDCSVEGKHAHLYTNDDGIVRYIDKEYEQYEGFARQDDYVAINDGEEDLYKFYDRKDLISFADNYEQLLKIQEQNKDYIEYRYRYKTRTTVKVGKTRVPVTHTHYNWTKDPNHSELTGETRICHYMYQACNVYIDENGKYVIVPSEWVDDISILKDQYEYVKIDCSKIVYLDDDLGLTNGTDVEKESLSNTDEVKKLTKNLEA